MDDVSIKSSKAISLPDIRSRLEERFEVADQDDPVVVLGKDSRVYIRSETEKEVALEYSSVALVNEVISVIADNPDMTVDADFGIVLRGDQFVAKYRANTDWDWRADWVAAKKRHN
jgi:hypothetical protein